MYSNFDLIDDDLYQGARPRRGDDLDFDVLVLAAEWQPKAEDLSMPEGAKIIRVPMSDNYRGPSREDVARATAAANRVLEALYGGKRVLVTCWSGWNRSGLISALTLVGRHGISGEAAVEHVKTAREGALQNPGYVKFLGKISAVI